MRVARADDLWTPHVRFDPADRHFVQLYRDVHVDLWLICWTNQQDTGFHDHDVSSGAVHVCAGELLEVRLEYDGRALSRRTVLHPQGSSFDFDASHVHSLGHPLGKAPAVSIHAYPPPLWRMGYYDTGDDGLLRRHSVTYAEETRPDPALAAGLGTRAAS